jgi:hypothetical protein
VHKEDDQDTQQNEFKLSEEVKEGIPRTVLVSQ